MQYFLGYLWTLGVSRHSHGSHTCISLNKHLYQYFSYSLYLSPGSTRWFNEHSIQKRKGKKKKKARISFSLHEKWIKTEAFPKGGAMPSSTRIPFFSSHWQLCRNSVVYPKKLECFLFKSLRKIYLPWILIGVRSCPSAWPSLSGSPPPDITDLLRTQGCTFFVTWMLVLQPGTLRLCKYLRDWRLVFVLSLNPAWFWTTFPSSLRFFSFFYYQSLVKMCHSLYFLVNMAVPPQYLNCWGIHSIASKFKVWIQEDTPCSLPASPKVTEVLLSALS